MFPNTTDMPDTTPIVFVDPRDTFYKNLTKQSIYLVILAIVTMVVTYFQVSFWMMPAERCVNFN